MTFNTVILLIHFIIKYREIDLTKLRKLINEKKYYFLQRLLFRSYHSLWLFNPWLKVYNWACQYFSLSHKTLSISSSFCTETFSINCTCKYSHLLVEERQTLRRWFATPTLILPVFIPFLWILNLSLKPVADPTYCLPQNFQDIK